MRDPYMDFLAKKSQVTTDTGFAKREMPSFLFPFQAALTEWALRRGRAAIFADCGLGKTAIELAWAQAIVEQTNRPVLILTPLAVAAQTMREAGKFGIEAHVCRNGMVARGINILNYESLHLVEAHQFAGVAGDESSILKSFDGVRRRQITEFLRQIPSRLLSTATPSPNEYVELGTHSEALGYLGYMDMLSRFFKNDQGNSIKPFIARDRGRNFKQLEDGAKWRLKGHAAGPFWQWVCSWARAIRKPSDLGFDDAGFVLPPLHEHSHLVASVTRPQGKLFALPAVGLQEQREERRRTIEDRCEYAARLVLAHRDPAAVWCQLNDEGDLLETLIPDCVQISGSDSDEEKEEKFSAFLSGQARVLVTKPRIGAWGLNFQHCAHSVSFSTHSFEEYYQSTRRFWRFGQTRPVVSDVVTTEGEKMILDNLQRKAAAASKMFEALVGHMNEGLEVSRSTEFTVSMELPTWL